MSIIAKSGAKYPVAPEGTHAAVCVDVVDLGLIPVVYSGAEKIQHKVRIAWAIDEQRDDGKPHIVGKRYTLSLHEKASLRHDLESWRGRAFSEAELEGFDLEELIGAAALLNVIHVTREGGGTFANIATIMRLPKMMEGPKITGHVREKDRTQVAGAHADPGYTPNDDDVPF